MHVHNNCFAHAGLDSIVLKTGLMGILAMQFHAETSEIPPGPFTIYIHGSTWALNTQKLALCINYGLHSQTTVELLGTVLPHYFCLGHYGINALVI